MKKDNMSSVCRDNFKPYPLHNSSQIIVIAPKNGNFKNHWARYKLVNVEVQLNSYILTDCLHELDRHTTLEFERHRVRLDKQRIYSELAHIDTSFVPRIPLFVAMVTD